MESKVVFQEKQKFTQWWLWIILLTPTLFIIYKIFESVLSNNNDGSENITIFSIAPFESGLALFILFFILLSMYFMTMSTAIDAEKIVVRHLYFVKKVWYWNEIESAEIITYGFVGYGIRISLKHGTVYNVKGNKGLFIKLKNGKKRLIGTQKSEELDRMVQSIL